MLEMITYDFLWLLYMLILGINGINLPLVNACLIKLDPLKVLVAVKPCQLFLVSALHVIYRSFLATC